MDLPRTQGVTLCRYASDTNNVITAVEGVDILFSERGSAVPNLYIAGRIYDVPPNVYQVRFLARGEGDVDTEMLTVPSFRVDAQNDGMGAPGQGRIILASHINPHRKELVDGDYIVWIELRPVDGKGDRVSLPLCRLYVRPKR